MPKKCWGCTQRSFIHRYFQSLNLFNKEIPVMNKSSCEPSPDAYLAGMGLCSRENPTLFGIYSFRAKRGIAFPLAVIPESGIQGLYSLGFPCKSEDLLPPDIVEIVLAMDGLMLFRCHGCENDRNLSRHRLQVYLLPALSTVFCHETNRYVDHRARPIHSPDGLGHCAAEHA